MPSLRADGLVGSRSELRAGKWGPLDYDIIGFWCKLTWSAEPSRWGRWEAFRVVIIRKREIVLA